MESTGGVRRDTRNAASARDSGSVSLELLLATPMLMGLVLLVVWAGDRGREGLTSTLAASEAAVAAGETCHGESDAACARAVAEQVVAARTQPGSGCTAATRLYGDGGVSGAAAKTVVVDVSCDQGGPGHYGVASGADGAVSFATGMHIAGGGLDASAIPKAGAPGEYTGDRPVDPMLCRRGRDPYPERPTERGPGNTDLMKSASWFSTSGRIPSTSPLLPPDQNYYLRCNRLGIRGWVIDWLSHDVVFAIWTEDARDPLFKKMKAGDSCVAREETGVDYLRIPKEHPQYLELKAGDSADANGDRLTYPIGLCNGIRSLFGIPSRGVFDLHVEIVSGGTGKIRLLCDGRACRPQPGDLRHAISYVDPSSSYLRLAFCSLLQNYLPRWADPPASADCDDVIAHWREHYKEKSS